MSTKRWWPPKLDYVEGRGATDVGYPDASCFCCEQAGGVRYLGTVVHDGSLQLYHLVHTEITNYFRCDLCGGAWENNRML